MTLSLLESLLMPLSLCLLMLGMGATLTPDHFRVIARRPLPVLIGLASQYGWMPLIAVALALGLQLTPATAVGLIILGCSAGGALSNFSISQSADSAFLVAFSAPPAPAVGIVPA